MTKRRKRAPGKIAREPADDSPIVTVPGYGNLTLRQKTFAERYREHGNGTRAAREAGYPGNDNTLSTAASRLMRNVRVRWYVAKLGENDEISRGQIVDLLRGEAVNGDHAGARVRAQELLGKTQGMFEDDSAARRNMLSDDVLIALIAKGDPALAAMLTRSLGAEISAPAVQTIEHQT